MPTEPQGNRRLFVPLGTRLTIPIVLLVMAVALGTYWGLVRTSTVTAMRSKEAAADMVAKLSSRSVMPAVVFADDFEMKRAVDDLAKNGEITDIELWGVTEGATPQPTKLLVEFHRPGGRPLGQPQHIRSEHRLEGNSARAAEPVISLDGKIVAVLAVRLSTAREAAALATLSKQVLYVSLGSALGLTLALLWVLRRLVLSPIHRLQQAAERLARGERAPAENTSLVGRVDDEVVRLANAFGAMAEAVRDREARLEVRNTELRLILDSVDQGFVSALLDGTLLPERSRIVAQWLGDLPATLTIWELLGRIDAAAQDWAEMAWHQASEGFLPIEVAIEQLPKRLVRDGQHFDVAYHPVSVDGRLERVVVVLTDVSGEVERQRALADQHEFSVLVDHFVNDRRGFYEFWNEATKLVNAITALKDPSDALKRDLHTLKGNARFLGLTRLAALCHSLEDSLKKPGPSVARGFEELRLGWEAHARRMNPLIRGGSSSVELSEEQYVQLLQAITEREAHPALAERLRGLRLEPTERHLNRAKTVLLANCKKLGKSALNVQIQHRDLRLPPGPFAPFWSVFSHVLNNAVDHGIEPDAERERVGKTLPGKVSLSTSLVLGEVVVEVSDDGAGIDWEQVRNTAITMNLPHQSQKDLELVLLSSGVSLKDRVTELSGRGVGLAAVATAVTSLGGRIEVESERGVGTTWRFRLPAGGASQSLPPSGRAAAPPSAPSAA